MLHAPYCSVTTPRSHYIPKSFQFLCCRRFFCFLSHSEQRIPFCHFQSFHVHTVLFLTFGGLTYTQLVRNRERTELVRNRGTCKRELSRSWENTEDCEGDAAADDDDDDDDDDDASNACDDNDDDDDDDAAGDAEGREELAKESSLALVAKY